MPEMGVQKVIRPIVVTTAQRDAIAAVAGMIVYNSDTGQQEEYTGAAWQAVGQPILTTHTAVLDAHTYEELAILRTGYYHSLSRYNNIYGSLAIAANRLYAIPFVVTRLMTFDRIAFYCETLAAGAFARLGIYKVGTNLYPGELVVDAGVVNVGGTGMLALVINEQLTKGVHFLAITSDGVPKGRIMEQRQNILGVDSTDPGTEYRAYNLNRAYAALPDPYTAGASLHAADTVCIMLRLASLD